MVIILIVSQIGKYLNVYELIFFPFFFVIHDPSILVA